MAERRGGGGTEVRAGPQQNSSDHKQERTACRKSETCAEAPKSGFLKTGFRTVGARSIWIEHTHTHTQPHTFWGRGGGPPLFSVKNSGRQMMKAKITRRKSLASITLVMVARGSREEGEALS